MEYESHLVDGNLNYLRLLVGIPNRYECYNCGEILKFNPYTNERASYS